MDRKLLDALNNVSRALSMLTDQLSKKDKDGSQSATGNALRNLDVNKQILQINEGIEQLKNDNKEILKNQKVLLEIAKNKEDGKTKLFTDSSDPKRSEMIRGGVSSIVLIAGGVLAIGMAFKLIGEVDFPSVIALSLALPMIAFAFEKISTLKGLKGKETLNLVAITLALSTSIMLSSYILGNVRPVGLYQLTTTVFIAMAFSALSIGMEKLANGVKNVDPKTLWKLPLVLVATSLAILGSSYLLANVRPVGLYQLTTTVFIALAFSALSYGIGKIADGIKGVDMKTMIAMPLVLITMSAAILGSSFLLAKVQPIGIFQFFTAIMIGLTFTALSLGLPFLSRAMRDIDVKKVAIIPLVMVTLSLAIMASSYIFNKTQIVPTNVLFNIVLQSLALSAIGISMGIAMRVVGKVPLGEVIKGGLVLVLIATTITATSLILGLGNYSVFPNMEWSKAAGLTMLGFGVSAFVLGAIVSSGVGAVALGVGLVSILAIAATVVATSAILGSAEYNRYPSLDWSTGVSNSLTAFGSTLSKIGLGGVLLNAIGSFLGTGPVDIAKSIVEVNRQFQSSTFNNYPSIDWARGVAESIFTFGSIMSNVGLGGILLNSIGDFMGSGPSDIVKSIVDVNNQFKDSDFTKFPSMDWAKGVAMSIVTFGGIISLSSIIGTLNKFGELIGSGPVDIAKSISEVDKIYQTGNFNRYPSDQWINGVSKSLSIFGSSLSRIGIGGIVLNSIGEFLGSGPVDIAKSIVDVDSILAKGSFIKYPSAEWINGVKSFSLLSDTLISLNSIDINKDKLSNNISALGSAYDKLSGSLRNLNTTVNSLDIDKLSAVKNLTGSIILMSLMDSSQFDSMMSTLDNKSKIFANVINDLETGTENRLRGINSITPIRSNVTQKAEQRSIDDLYNVVSELRSTLKSIASSSDNVSKFADEQRIGGNNTIKNRKN